MPLRYVAASGLAMAGASLAASYAWQKLYPKAKGWLGERHVRRILSHFKSPDFYRLHDLLIPRGRETSQLDHVLVSRQGIFVIETKNYTGEVLGRPDQPMWLHCYPSGKTREFQNPLFQNAGHIRALRQLLRGYPDVPIYSIVVFSNRCRIPPIADVLNMRFLRMGITARCKAEPVISAEAVQDIGKLIQSHHIVGRKARRQHEGRAILSAGAAKHQTRESVEAFLEQGRNAPLRTFGQQKDLPTWTEEQKKLTDAGAILNIRGNRASIEDIFEGAKRDATGNPVPKGGNFDHFICPYTGDSFPPSEAKSLYHGLWITYLKRNPDLAQYLRDHPSSGLGVSFRCQKVLSAYAKDPNAFIAEAQDTLWYKNMEKRRSVQRAEKAFRSYTDQYKPLDYQINDAESRKTRPDPGKTYDKDYSRSQTNLEVLL